MSQIPSLSRRSFVAGALATSAAIAMAGAQVALADEQVYDSDLSSAQPGGVMSWYLTNPVAIEPFGAEENQGVQVMYCLFDTLTTFDWEKGQIVPQACESYEANEDATQFTFHLRPEAKFHNGQPVTAADFKYSWERLCNPNFKPAPSSLGYKANPIKGAVEMQAGEATELDIECPDDFTLVVNLAAPFSDFDSAVADYAFAPVPAGSTDDEDAYQAFRVAPIGNGPFKMEGEWVDAEYIQIVRNDDYWGEKPLLDGINFNIFNDDQTAWNEFSAGNLDFTLVPSGQFNNSIAMYGEAEKDGYVSNPGAQTLSGDEASIYYLLINNEDELMSNQDIRIAMSYAINRQAVCDTVAQGTKSPACDILSPGVPGCEVSPWPHCPATSDYEKAGEYFDKAGYPANADGKRDLHIVLSTNSNSFNNDLMTMIQADLAACGVEAEINQMEWAAYIDALQTRNYQCGRLGWTIQAPSPYMVLQPLFYTGSGDNNSSYSNPEFDAAIDYAGTVVDQDERTAAYVAANEIVANDFPIIPLFYYKHYYVTSARVNNFFYNPLGYARMQRTWLSA